MTSLTLARCRLGFGSNLAAGAPRLPLFGAHHADPAHAPRPRHAGARGEELVESLFCLAHARGSRLVLLGIANSIDLVQQLMRPGGSLHVSGSPGWTRPREGWTRW